MEREIPRLIIEKNLYGLDIDDRAYQLACFSVVMKALEYNKRFLRSIERDGLMLNLASLQETNGLTDDEIAYLAGDSVGERFEKMKTFILQFKNAKAIGSLIKIESYDQEFLQQRLKTIEQQAGDLFEIEMKDRILPLYKKIIKQASLMTQQYDIFITNPPYAGNKYLPVEVSTYLKRKYPDVKSDLFSAFIEYSFTMTKENGQMGFMTPFVWMFISSYEKLRQNINNNRTISSLIQLEYSGFDEATVPICTFTLKNYYSNTTGEYIKLSDFKGSRIQPVKTLEAINNPEVAYRYSVSQRDFIALPGNTIAYWLERDLKELFKNYKTIGDDYIVRKGLSTGNNEKFLRFWYEVDFNKINFNFTDINEVYHVKDVWVPYIKGGKYQKWFGNLEYVLRFGELNISEMSRCPGHRFDGKDYYFKESLTWSAVTSGKFSMRYVPKGFAFDQKGPILTSNEKDLYTLLGFMNSTIVQDLLDAISPTLDYSQGPISKIPSISLKNETKLEINKLVRRNIEIAQELFSLYEENWYFKKHFLLKDSNTLLSENIKISSKSLEDLSNELIHNEQKINNLLKMELNINKTEMIKENNTFTDTVHYVKESILSFISYAIGCIFGRYSLDEDGLVYAGGKFDPGRYQKYPVDKDNILPILSEAYFEDDIVSRFVEFVKVTFGEETLEENLEFIADTLGKRNGETARETIRRYFLNDFFKDHVQTYKKRPIYWLFTSGKQKAFNCLIYMHRYDKTTLSRIRTDYLHPLQIRLDAERKSLLEVIEGGGTAKEISNAKKELKQLDLKIDELKAYDELLHHMADMQIEIDLDDGVAVNYAKFNGLLAKLD
jgi:type II restriction/modification system DNA methylase subunit YeeA